MTERRPRRFLWLLVFALAAGGFWFWRATRDPWPAQQGISVPPGEELDTARIVADTIALIDRGHVEGRAFARSSFAKAHACLRATVEVPSLEPRLRHGLFARPGRYQAWIRFSNGSARPSSDQRRDAHGLALKVMGVPGAKLLGSERDADTQDFLLSDSPRFPVASVREYARLVEARAQGRRFSFFFHASFLPWRWRVRESWIAFRARRAAPASLLQTQYYSGTAYRLGPEQFVKFGARPCQWKRPPRGDRTEDMLRVRLKETLAGGEGCLELTVQLQVAGKNMPVEDPTVLWSEKDSPFQPVARVVIPKQVFDSPAQDRFCQDLSFNPWHALPGHEPVGGLNRVRKAVYREISRYRHARNGAPQGEPRGYCLDLTGATCPAAPVAPAAAPTAPVVPSPKATPKAKANGAPTPEAAAMPEPGRVATPTPTVAPAPETTPAPETVPPPKATPAPVPMATPAPSEAEPAPPPSQAGPDG